VTRQRTHGGENSMMKVACELSISLDGYSAGLNQTE
jgi:hypothetical protein